jgi:hypothetical protein
MKNQFGLSVFYLQLVEFLTSLIDKYGPPVDNLQSLLRQPIFEKTRLIALHLQYNKETTITVSTRKRKVRVLMTLIHCSPLPLIIIAKHSLQTDNSKHQHLMLLSESTSLSQ